MSREAVHAAGLFMADLPSAEWIEFVDALAARVERLERELAGASLESDERGAKMNALSARAERLEAAYRLAVRAFAQYAEDTDEPSDEAVAGFMEGFLQDADLRAVGGGGQ